MQRRLSARGRTAPTPPLLESPRLAELSGLGCAGKNTEGLKAIDQILARRRLAPMNELTEAAKRTVARCSDGPMSVGLVGSEAVS